MNQAGADRTIGLEVCVASPADAVVAAEAGATQVELNSALELGGLTPSIGSAERTVRVLKPFGCAVIAMVRPRPGGFAYNPDALDTMRADIDRLLEAGVDGVALGVLQDGGTVDERACADLIGPILASNREAVFHRAFDLTPDPLAALEQLIGLGFHRVLTSGGAATAMEGSELIRELIECAAGRIEVLPGGGIRPNNVAALIEQTGCKQVHASLRTTRNDLSTSANPALSFSSIPLPESQYGVTDAEHVCDMVRVLRGR